MISVRESSVVPDGKGSEENPVEVRSVPGTVQLVMPQTRER